MRPGLQALHQILHFRQHLLRLLARAVLGHVLEIAHHALEIFLAEHLVLLVAGLRLLLLLAALLRELLHELVEGLPQLRP